MYISAWRIHTSCLRAVVNEEAAKGKIKKSDVVWVGPSGDAVIASTPADLSEDYADYVDSGQVSEYLD